MKDKNVYNRNVLSILIHLSIAYKVYFRGNRKLIESLIMEKILNWSRNS